MKQPFKVEPYDADVWVIVGDDWQTQLRTGISGKYLTKAMPRDCSCSAITIYGMGYFAVCFHPQAAKSVRLVGHEVFHLTYRIMDWMSCGTTNTGTDTEAFAHLHGYLLEVVFRKLKKGGYHVC